MSTIRQYLNEEWNYRGDLRNQNQKSEFRREFWNYINLRSQKYRSQTVTVENSKRSRWVGASSATRCDEGNNKRQ